MKINSIKIKKFKRLVDFEICFKDPITILLGRNGVGKSNLLEAITEIFIGLQYDIVPLFDFNIKYECNKTQIEIVGDKVSGHKFFLDGKETVFSSAKEIILPDNVIVYYSGGSGRMENVMKKPEEKRSKTLRKNEDNNNFFCYYRHFYYKIILLSLFSFPGDIARIHSEFLKEKFGIETLLSFKLKFNKPSWAKESKNFWGAGGRVGSFLNSILSLSDGGESNFNSICLDFQSEEKIHEVREKAGYEKDLFIMLETAYFDGLLDDIEIKFKKVGSDEIINNSDLSEGEKQLIAIKGLVEFLDEVDKETLFLYDEPDNFFHPEWQRDFIKDLENSRNSSQIILTTHSPLLAQSAEDVNTVLLKKERGKVVTENKTFDVKNCRIDQVLTSELFGLKSARPRYLDEFMKKRKEILEKKDFSLSDEEELKKMTSEYGLLPTGETLEEFEAIKFIKDYAEELKEKNDKNK